VKICVFSGKKKNILKILVRCFRIILISFGAVFLVLIILAFTSAPFWQWYNFSVKHARISRPPDFIIILGGGGMPSETGLMRTWYGAKAANYFTHSKVIIALPGDSKDSLSSLRLMKNELILRGVNEERILLEDSGTNTRAQAMNILRKITNYELRITDTSHKSQGHKVTKSLAILIITSPEHLTRSVLTFKKAGFLKVDGVPAFETTIESDVSFNDRMLGGRQWIPGIGGNLTLRYQFWTQLRYEELMIREYLAMFYYKLKGWI
jgi:uncharacterized SAM-binding protein YcdF (DUF218 family)